MDTNEQTMPTKYDPSAIEKGRYDFWLKGKYFEAGGDQTKQPYSVVIPPPNVTGRLHLGHAWDTTLQDIVTRMKRMQGYDVLWLPGMDTPASPLRQKSKRNSANRAQAVMISAVKSF